MSEQDAKDYVEIPRDGDAAFTALMDALAPEEETSPAAEGAGEGAAADGAAADGGTDAAGGGTGATGSAPAANADGAAGAAGADAAPAGTSGGGDAGAPAGDPQQPATSGGEAVVGAVDVTEIAPQLSELTTKIEERVTEEYQQAALTEVREEYPNYFTAIEQHPRMLVGTEVPALGREGMETLRSTEEAREWQDAVKHLLVGEIRDRAGARLEENSSYLETLHSSIELFQKNADLIPGTKQFDRELADRFADMVKPYELRVEGKLHGYSIPVQPIVDQIRTQIQAQRAAASSTPGAPAAPAKPAKPADPPQAAVPSKAGSSNEAEEFSTLFGTIGLPNLQI